MREKEYFAVDEEVDLSLKEGMDRYVMILEPIHLICEDDIMNGSFDGESCVEGLPRFNQSVQFPVVLGGRVDEVLS